MPGRSPRDKGDRGEREFVNHLIDTLKIPARRGQMRGHKRARNEPDIIVAETWRAESKFYASSAGHWGGVKKWLGDADCLRLRENGQAAIYVLTEPMFDALLTCWHEGLELERECARQRDQQRAAVAYWQQKGD